MRVSGILWYVVPLTTLSETGLERQLSPSRWIVDEESDPCIPLLKTILTAVIDQFKGSPDAEIVEKLVSSKDPAIAKFEDARNTFPHRC